MYGNLLPKRFSQSFNDPASSKTSTKIKRTSMAEHRSRSTFDDSRMNSESKAYQDVFTPISPTRERGSGEDELLGAAHQSLQREIDAALR